jgi:N-hydroxyarylamine O-acetyltransferase
MTPAFDLSAYLARIGDAGEVAPTFTTLRAMQLAHACSIPFENLDVLLGKAISLAPDDIARKLIIGCRGGYCFETNGLLLMALQSLGFQVQPLSARVRYKLERPVTPPATHLFIQVDLDGETWAVDVGVGGVSPTAPIRLHLVDEPQPTPHEPRRILQVADGPYPRFVQQAQFGSEWIDVHEFTGQVMPDIDRIVANWWTSTYAGSKFRQNLIISLARPDGTRLSVLNEQFIHRRGGEILESHVLASHEEMRQLLAQRFSLTWDAATQLHWPQRPASWQD